MLDDPDTSHPAIRWWLGSVLLLIAAIVVVGGITRLTESGLSIVDWKPVAGVLPPLNHEAWIAEFARYKASPQYRLENHWMTLGDFQRIFFWEYVHRLLARGIGLVALLPWLYFAWRGWLRGRELLLTALVPLGVAAQGALGWFMVSSGLVDEPAVSHFRLAAHLLLAFGLAQWVLWLLLRTNNSQRPYASRQKLRSYDYAITILVVILSWFQVLWGAFTAGKNAGIIFATFPHMGGRYAPTYFVASLRDTLTDPVAIHWTHRAGALALTLATMALASLAWRWPRPLRRSVQALVLVIAVQIGLGAATVMSHVHIVPAVLHQLVGLAVVSCGTWIVTGMRESIPQVSRSSTLPNPTPEE